MPEPARQLPALTLRDLPCVARYRGENRSSAAHPSLTRLDALSISSAFSTWQRSRELRSGGSESAGFGRSFRIPYPAAGRAGWHDHHRPPARGRLAVIAHRQSCNLITLRSSAILLRKSREPGDRLVDCLPWAIPSVTTRWTAFGQTASWAPQPVSPIAGEGRGV